jgi:hypothetical protein
MKIQITQPCHEDWNRMKAGETSRHCSSCAVWVRDFSLGNREEALQEIAQAKQDGNRICGRFPKAWLVPEVVSTRKQANGFWIGLSVALLWFQVESRGQSTTSKPKAMAAYVQEVQPLEKKLAAPKPPMGFFLWGKIRDQTGDVVAFGVIQIQVLENGKWTTRTSGQADMDGKYRIAIPLSDSTANKQMQVVAGAITYESRKIVLWTGDVQQDQEIELNLTLSNTTIMTTVGMISVQYSRPQRLYYRIRNSLRRLVGK